MLRPALAIAAALMCGAVVIACADDGPETAQRGQIAPSPTLGTTPDPAESTAPAPPGTADPAPVDPVPAEPNGLSVRVQSLDNFFRDEVIEITAGTEVVWTNDGRIDHDVTPSDGGDWGVAADLFAPGDEHRHVFTLPGEYPYYCSIHGTADFGQLGLVIVTESA